MKHYEYKTQGTCSRAISFDLDENNTIYNCKFEGGCNGNLKGICKLVEGKNAKEVSEVLALLDHKDLNELEFFAGMSPSSEMIARFIYKELKKKFYTITKVSVWETDRACATYFED